MTKNLNTQTKHIIIYLIITIICMVALSYGAVPLYRIFCQVTGYGGTVQIIDQVDQLISLPTTKKLITIRFNANTSNGMPWEFTPAQKEMKVFVGESALAFYQAYNPTDNTIIGISTYNVTPSQAGIYFNKIQCFCFDEQMLKSKEFVEMPLFFFIDPTFLDDPKMDNVQTITLSYTFFPSEEYHNYVKTINPNI